MSSTLDPTFRKYDSQQASSYSDHRGSYSSSLYDEILLYHIDHDPSGTRLHTLLDVGCGPGNVTRSLAAYFDHAYGFDPSPGMIEKAQSIGGQTEEANPIQYEVLGAEELARSKLLEPNSVDLLTAGMAFWPQAARILKPGGTVALWTKASLYCHPSTPNASTVQSILSNLEDHILSPYELPPNTISRNLYTTLLFPWHLQLSLPFSQHTHFRHEWNRDGHIPHSTSDFFGGTEYITLSTLAAQLGTASMVTRWREANPALVGTKEDCVEITLRGMARAMTGMNEEQVDDEVVRKQMMAETKIGVGAATVLLLFRKNGERSC